MNSKTCIECGAEEIRTYRRGTLVSTSIDPISKLCVKCLPRRAAAAPAGSLFDRIGLEHHDAKAAAARNDD